jgi:DNA-binding NarL/FixJ family response regulator
MTAPDTASRDDAISVILADDHRVVRAGLKAVLGTARDITVVSEAANGREALGLTERFRPQVLLLDLTMPEMDGLAVLREIVARQLPTRVLILTMHAEEEYLVQALEAGAAGYLVKSAADRELVDAVRAVARGDVYVQPAAGRVLARGLQRSGQAVDERARYEKLTVRERDVLRLVAEGYSAPEIGERLFISPKTVDTYKQRINEKLSLDHRADYVKLALKLGLLSAS